MEHIINRIYTKMALIHDVRKVLRSLAIPLALMAFHFPTVLQANEVDVVKVTVAHIDGRDFRINATLKHADTGWDHFANKWVVRDEKGNLLGTRILVHPHVNEQPFTRSLTLTIPEGIKEVTIVAFDSVHDDGGLTLTVKLPDV